MRACLFGGPLRVMTPRASALSLFCLAFAAVTAQAHHSLERSNDLKREVTLQGSIIQVLMRNPHSILQINVLDKDGNAQRVPLEFPKGLSTLRKQGVNA